MTTRQLKHAARNSAITTGLLLLVYITAEVVFTLFLSDHRNSWGRLFGWLALSMIVAAGTCLYSLLRLWWSTRKQTLR
jgi:hypothetical protein